MNGIVGPETEASDPLASLPDVYSRRKRVRSGTADPLQCDFVPPKVRIQILHVVDNALRVFATTFLSKKIEFYDPIRDFLRKELGVLRLAHSNNSYDEVANWFLNADGTDEVADCIECLCRQLLIWGRSYSALREKAPSCLQEINGRLFEAGSGFQFESERIVEANSKYLHSEVVVPALELLGESKYAAANSEFLAAHQSFREQDYEQCLVECCKAFESVIKVIAAERDWLVGPDASAKALVKAVFENELIPSLLESEFTGIRTVLESGVNTVRNKAGGHGAGTKVRVVPRHLAAFQLHQTAAAITLLSEAHAA